jgi:hypothetical protein
MTVWPQGRPKPEWPTVRAGAEPTFNTVTSLTVIDKASSREPLLIFTYRPLRLSLASVLQRERNQDKCEA